MDTRCWSDTCIYVSPAEDTHGRVDVVPIISNMMCVEHKLKRHSVTMKARIQLGMIELRALMNSVPLLVIVEIVLLALRLFRL